MRFAAVRNRRSTGGAVCENEQRVVRRSVAVHADGVEGARSNVAKRTLQQGGRNGGVSYYESERSGHVRMNHARAFGTPDKMDSLAGHFKGRGSGLWSRVRGTDGE